MKCSERLIAMLLSTLLLSPAGAAGAGGGGIPGKPVIYQMFTRLFGNQVTRNRPWGTIAENGVGKLSDINAEALRGIRELGVTHLWYTGVLHHASVTDYSAQGIAADDPDVVKGRAGSPYAVRDYYSIDPDLADDPGRRLEEFRALVARSHAAGLRVIIDIVPNHVARRYASPNRPPGVPELGAADDTAVTYARDNHFYYVVGEEFRVPAFAPDQQPLGGEAHPLADGLFAENPAKWTGNGARAAQPAVDDWYETVRINYGVRPDGSHDFPALPEAYRGRAAAEHSAFWATRDLPDSWYRMREIVMFWLDQGVDGFRYDMAELVPVEFWSFLNASIKERRPDALLLAEVYQPPLYRDYIGRGLMDYLYAKVDLYDTLFGIVRGEQPTEAISEVHRSLSDIDDRLLTFLENHDELRIASPGFAGDPQRGLPAMAVAALLWRGPTMLYFGQEVGEAALGDPGFGDPWDTTIFDYWGLPAHQRWMNGSRFDGAALRPDERRLREDYARLLTIARDSAAMRGLTVDISRFNRDNPDHPPSLFAFARVSDAECLLVLANFSRESSARGALRLPISDLAACPAADRQAWIDALDDRGSTATGSGPGLPGTVRIDLPPLAWRVLRASP